MKIKFKETIEREIEVSIPSWWVNRNCYLSIDKNGRTEIHPYMIARLSSQDFIYNNFTPCTKQECEDAFNKTMQFLKSKWVEAHPNYGNLETD